MLPISLLSGCSSEAVNKCEAWIKGQVKSPGSYHQAEVSETNYQQSHFVTIKFDSQNGFGALIRSEGICKFKDENGAPGELDQTQSTVIDGSGPLGGLTR